MQLTRTRLLGLVIILLTGTASWEGYVLATPSPSQNLVCEPGGCNGPNGCTDYVSLDGTTPVDSRTHNSQVVGTAGQNIGAFFNANAVANERWCFSAQTFSGDSFSIPSNTSIIGSGKGATIFSVGGQTVSSAVSLFVNSNAGPGTGNSRLTIRDLSIIGNNGKTSTTQKDTGSGIIFIGVTDFLINNIEVYGMAGAAIQISRTVTSGNFYASSTNPPYSAQGYITNSAIVSWAFNAIVESNVRDVHVSNNCITGGDTPVNIASNTKNVNATWIDHNTIDETGCGTGLTPTLAPGQTQVEIASNQANVTAFVESNSITGRPDPLLDVEQALATVYVNAIITDNLFFGKTPVSSSYNGVRGIQIQKTTRGLVKITGNVFRDLDVGIDAEARSIIANNVGQDFWACLVCVAANNTFILGNTVDHSTVSANNHYGGITVGTNGVGTFFNIMNTTISDNICYDTWATKTTQTCISYKDGGTDLGNNIVRRNTATSFLNVMVFGFAAKGDVVTLNVPFNPIGKVTNFIAGSFIGACGTGTTVVSTTVYTICLTDITWGCTGGTVTAIVEKDNLGNQIFSVANCAALPATDLYTPIGYSITFTFSVAPTVSVFAN